MRLTFLVNRGENDCFMVHGLDWATYREGQDWPEIISRIRADVHTVFPESERPDFLDFKFPDGSVVSMSA